MHYTLHEYINIIIVIVHSHFDAAHLQRGSNYADDFFQQFSYLDCSCAPEGDFSQKNIPNTR
jgi:hypothetical protein